MLRKAGVQSQHKLLMTWGGITSHYVLQLAKNVFKANTVVVMATAAEADQGKDSGSFRTPRGYVFTCTTPWVCVDVYAPRGYFYV